MYVKHLVKNSRDEVSLEMPIALIMKLARADKSFRLNRIDVLSQECQRCGAISTDAHHKTPIWALAADFAMQIYLTSSPKMDCVNFTKFIAGDCMDYKRGQYSIISDKQINAWNSKANLVALCFRCHQIAQMIDDRKWKLRLSKRYRLVYSKKWLDGVIFRRLKRDVDYNDYTENYLRELHKGLQMEIDKLWQQHYTNQ